MMPELTSVGRIIKTHGVDGEVNVTFQVENIDQLLAASPCVMIYDEGLPVPFFLAGTRPRGEQSRLLKFEDVISEDLASGLVGREIFLPSELVRQYEPGDDGDGLFASDLVGFKVIDDDNGAEIGVISDIDEQTENALFIVDTPRGTALIPISDEYIVGIDTDAKSISLSLPEGLLEAVTTP